MDNPQPISAQARERWFFITMGLATLALVRLMAPFLPVMLFAAVVAVVAWPLRSRLAARMGGREALAAGTTVLVLVVAVFGPLVTMLALIAQQAVKVASLGIEYVQQGRLQKMLARIDLDALKARLPDAVASQLPEDIPGALAQPLQDAALAVLNALGAQVPALLNTTAGAVLDIAVFFACVVTFLVEGERLVKVIVDISPLDDALDRELLRVFAQLCNNLVMGAFGTAFVMGAVAFTGYALAGVPRSFMWGALTGFMSFVPVVGSALVFGPIAAWAATEMSSGTALFIIGWSVLLTAQVDTLVRPLFMSGGVPIHPVAIILSLMGGVSWLGAPGALLGPVIVAFFWTLYGIYGRHHLGWPPEDEAAAPATGWLERLKARLSRPSAPPPTVTEPVSPSDAGTPPPPA